MSQYATQTLANAGTTPTYAAVTASDTAAIGNGRNTFLVVKNGSASPITATLAIPGNDFVGQAEDDNIVTVANASEKWIPLRSEYDDGSGLVTVTYSATATVTAAVVRLG